MYCSFKYINILVFKVDNISNFLFWLQKYLTGVVWIGYLGISSNFLEVISHARQITWCAMNNHLMTRGCRSLH